jgi:hypothetical protein
MEDAGKFEAPSGDLKAKFEAIKLNNDRLNACPRHLFDTEVPGIDGGVGAMFGRKMICRKCGGQMDLVALNFYVRGYEAHGGNGNDILPGWKPTELQRKFFKGPQD